MSGKNTSGSTVTVSYSIYKNSILVASSSQASITNNVWWTQSHHRVYDVVVGDIIEARVWTPTAGVYLDYHAFAVAPSRIEVTKDPLVQDLNITLINHPTLTLGVPQISVGGAWLHYPHVTGLINFGVSTGVAIPHACINSSVQGYLGRAAQGDASVSSGVQTHGTIHPYYYRNAVPSAITFREVMR